MKRMRTTLSVPGNSAKMQAKALHANADLLLFDLEDSVPLAEKERARQQIVETLSSVSAPSARIGLRINGVDTPLFYWDVIEVIESIVDCVETIVIPKVRDAGDIACVSRLLDGIEQHTGASRAIQLQACIETPSGLVQAEAIAQASPRMEALVFGIADYSTSIGAQLVSISGHGENEEAIYDGHRWHYVLSRMVACAKAFGLQAIDAPYGHFRDVDGLERSAAQARALGCDGKWAIHPVQLEPIRNIFSPTPEEVALARRVVQAAENAQAQGRGAIALDGRMIDHATIQLARAVLENADPERPPA